MKMRLILVVTGAMLGCGFVVLSPDDRGKLAADKKEWYRDVADQFDRKALHGFLKKNLGKIKRVGDLDVSVIDAGTKFIRRDDFALGAGRWLFVTENPKAEVFELRTFVHPRGWAVLVCERQSKKTFKIVGTHVDSVIQLCPPPYSFSP
jgi:hypothetical protein